MFSSIQIHDLRGACLGFTCSHDREDWRIFLEALDTDDGERLIRSLGVEAHPCIAVLQSVVVCESHRGQNFGRRLVADFLRVADAQAVVTVAGRSARTFFQSLGFVACGDGGLMVLRPGIRDAGTVRLAA
ncbi:MAG: GNAT family N-acetyltransferase [Sterolibacteriaceae bacterium MAG5]|nr:GNAT family N-acetyltransferase [Candidatus Nitricoxidireducens bremensis]